MENIIKFDNCDKNPNFHFPYNEKTIEGSFFSWTLWIINSATILIGMFVVYLKEYKPQNVNPNMLIPLSYFIAITGGFIMYRVIGAIYFYLKKEYNKEKCKE